jgi:thiosulfate/3-mercaptopyruvate sulfurtransferase
MQNDRNQMSDAIPPGPLVSTEWLAAHLDDPRVRIVDVRGKVLPPTDPKPHYLPLPEDYAAAHIPGAVFVDWTRDIIDDSDPVPVQVAPPEQIAALCARLGIGHDTLVVAYDDSFSMFAGRFTWVLRFYGHEGVRVLNGGLVKWRNEGRPVTTEAPTFPPAQFTPRPQPALRRTAEQVLASLGDDTLLIDARNESEFHGRESRAKRGGHIPGAANVFYRDIVSGPDQTYAEPEAIRERFAQAGVDLDALDGREVVAYCNGGVSATPMALGIELVTGKRPAIYDGSWNEWGNDESKPLET